MASKIATTLDDIPVGSWVQINDTNWWHVYLPFVNPAEGVWLESVTGRPRALTARDLANEWSKIEVHTSRPPCFEASRLRAAETKLHEQIGDLRARLTRIQRQQNAAADESVGNVVSR